MEIILLLLAFFVVVVAVGMRGKAIQDFINRLTKKDDQ